MASKRDRMVATFARRQRRKPPGPPNFPRNTIPLSRRGNRPMRFKPGVKLDPSQVEDRRDDNYGFPKSTPFYKGRVY